MIHFLIFSKQWSYEFSIFSLITNIAIFRIPFISKMLNLDCFFVLVFVHRTIHVFFVDFQNLGDYQKVSSIHSDDVLSDIEYGIWF